MYKGWTEKYKIFCIWAYRFHLLILGCRPVVDQRVVVEEQPARDVERNEHVDAVVLVGSEDEEDSEAVAQPREGVQEEDPSGGVLGYEEVEQREWDGVAGEHVVPACAYSLKNISYIE